MCLNRSIRREYDDERGFTLIELLVVIIIIGILAAIAIPIFLNQRKKGYDAAVKSDLRNAATAEETYLVDYNAYTSNQTTLSSTENFKTSSTSNYQGSAATITITLDANNGYCMKAVSASGATWIYNSEKGGLQDKSITTCSFT